MVRSQYVELRLQHCLLVKAEKEKDNSPAREDAAESAPAALAGLHRDHWELHHV